MDPELEGGGAAVVKEPSAGNPAGRRLRRLETASVATGLTADLLARVVAVAKRACTIRPADSAHSDHGALPDPALRGAALLKAAAPARRQGRAKAGPRPGRGRAGSTVTR